MKRLISFDYLRVFATFCVCWPHLTVIINPYYDGITFMRKLLIYPLSLSNDLGMIGVSLFFIMSGFFLSFYNKDVITFIKDKYYRLIIPLWLNILIFYLFIKITDLFTISYWSQFSNQDWIKSLTLYNFIIGYPEHSTGVLWYLVPQLTFFTIYALICKYKYKIWLFPCVLWIVILINFWLLNLNVYNSVGFISYLPYLTIPLLGYFIGLFYQKKITFFTLLICSIICYIETLISFYQSAPHWIEQKHLISCLYAFFLVLSCSFYEQINSSIKINKYISLLSSISYTFYIIHALYGGWIISFLDIHYTYKLIIAILITIGISTLIHFKVEKKFLKFRR